MVLDVLIKNGTIVDGTRLPRYRGDVGIKDGRIVEMGSIHGRSALREIDATGLVVAPGFVDLHTHYDAQIYWDPYCTISGWHGVTSVVLGNCGFGFAPVAPDQRERAMLMMSRNEAIPLASMQAGMPWDWETYPEFLDSLERTPKGVNCISYFPISPLMIWVMGLDEAKSGRPATAAEREEMCRLLSEGIDAGGCGWSVQKLGDWSFQRDYDGTPLPTDLMDDELCFALADVLGEHGTGSIQVSQHPAHHETLEEKAAHWKRIYAFQEELARRSGRPIIHNVIMPSDQYPQLFREKLAWFEDCARRGLRVIGQGQNRVFFTFSLDNWNLFDTAPAWAAALQGTPQEILGRLADPAIRAAMVADADAGRISPDQIGGRTPVGLVVDRVGGHHELDHYLGLTVGEIASAEGKHPVEVMLDLSIASDLEVEFRTPTAASQDPALHAEMLRSEFVMAGTSDGGAHTKFFVGGSYTTELLTWLVRDSGELSLEDAHWHLSYLPAQIAGFKDRGFLREGAPADIVVYDLDALSRSPENDYELAWDFPAGEWRRIQHAEGYRFILVNGEVTFEDGKETGATPGRLLRHGVG